MWCMGLFWPSLVLGVVLLPMLAAAPQADAQGSQGPQDRSKIEIVPIIPHSSSGIRAVAFSPDGARVLSAGVGERTIKLWDVAIGALVRTFGGHKGHFGPGHLDRILARRNPRAVRQLGQVGETVGCGHGHTAAHI